MEKRFVYGEDAIEWLDFALGDMRRRTGWEFDEDMVEYLANLVSDVGLDVSSPSELRNFTDNAFVNWQWGYFGDNDFDELKTEADFVAAYEQGKIAYYNAETKLYII